MALTLLSFFALAIAGFGGCQSLTRRMELPTNALIDLGLGFFAAMAVVGFVVSRNWFAVSSVSHTILLISCCGAAVTAVGFIRGSTPSLWARVPLNSRLAWFNALCLCAVALRESCRRVAPPPRAARSRTSSSSPSSTRLVVCPSSPSLTG